MPDADCDFIIGFSGGALPEMQHMAGYRPVVRRQLPQLPQKSAVATLTVHLDCGRSRISYK
jgi:hypothetical protein